MLNIEKIYEWLFSSFRINGSNNLIQILKSENLQQCMIIKRSWVFGLYASFNLFIILGINITYIFFISNNTFSENIISYIPTSIMTINVIVILYSGFKHLKNFYIVHSKWNPIFKISEAEIFINKEETIFAKFFNQITFSYLFFIVITLFHIIYVIFFSPVPWDTVSWIYIISLCFQIFFIFYYRRLMIDLNMDYVIVVSNRLYFIDQVWLHINNQILKLVNDILIIKGSYPNFISSLFNYGTIEISAKYDKEISAYDTPDLFEMFHMHYVFNPIETANNMNKILLANIIKES